MFLEEKIQSHLKNKQFKWLITGVAGFIGSHLLENLLKLDQEVVGLDNFSTGSFFNLSDVRRSVSKSHWGKFQLVRGDIRDIEVCRKACCDVDYVLHQAALGSVPRSIVDPIKTNENNVDGFLNILVATKEAQKVKKLVYATSSSTYGDSNVLPKKENVIGAPLSPYAVSKYVNELYAEVFFKSYGLKTTGLRYFNVFGPRQNPNGEYSAVIPRWVIAILKENPVIINGDGSTSRDFCYIDNVVQANILAAIATENSESEIYNIACGEQTNLIQLYNMLVDSLNIDSNSNKLEFRNQRLGDVKHSLADIDKAKSQLGYIPNIKVREGIKLTCDWFSKNKNDLQIYL